MKFRPCIDLHAGKVKQIVGSTLRGRGGESPVTNYISDQPPAYYAAMYRRDNLAGGHVIMLGPGNEQAALEALAAYPGGLQVGGGITAENAASWLARGADGVIVTSYVFRNGRVDEQNLQRIAGVCGRENLILDLSCRRRDDDYFIVTDRWQNFTDVILSRESLAYFATFCREFLIHAVDVEGKCDGIDEVLAGRLGQWITIPTTYAGGVKSLADMYRIKDLAGNRLDATIGSALDIFGGHGVQYSEAVAFSKQHGGSSAHCLANCR